MLLAVPVSGRKRCRLVFFQTRGMFLKSTHISDSRWCMWAATKSWISPPRPKQSELERNLRGFGSERRSFSLRKLVVETESVCAQDAARIAELEETEREERARESLGEKEESKRLLAIASRSHGAGGPPLET